jgi:ABC-type branched-subunit amino acid transport system permease subunit
MFAISALFMTLTGAVMAPRWTYIDPAIAFSPMLSFEVVIMALLGGAASLFGPVLGAVPLVLLFEVLTANFPNYFSILLGVVFVLIVYVLPRGSMQRRSPRPCRPLWYPLRRSRSLARHSPSKACARRSAASSRWTI